MFESPRYIQNNFNVVFPRQSMIRRKANELEDRLRGSYVQPQIVPVPDELDPEIPRIIFGSEHGFSQIIVSQINIALNVTYSPDWQTDVSRGKSYLLERASIVFELLECLGDIRPYFCGLTSRVRLPSKMTDQEILNFVGGLLLKRQPNHDTHDFVVKTTTVHKGRFFSNLTLRNYRSWRVESSEQGMLRLSRKDSNERGIEIIGDFNDRYAFNEQSDYKCSRDSVSPIVDGGLSEVGRMLDEIGK